MSLLQPPSSLSRATRTKCVRFAFAPNPTNAHHTTTTTDTKNEHLQRAFTSANRESALTIQQPNSRTTHSLSQTQQQKTHESAPIHRWFGLVPGRLVLGIDLILINTLGVPGCRTLTPAGVAAWRRVGVSARQGGPSGPALTIEYMRARCRHDARRDGFCVQKESRLCVSDWDMFAVIMCGGCGIVCWPNTFRMMYQNAISVRDLIKSHYYTIRTRTRPHKIQFVISENATDCVCLIM